MTPCRKMVELPGSVASHQCRFGLPEGHAGPCATPDMPRSVKLRAIWETESNQEQVHAAPRLSAAESAEMAGFKTDGISGHLAQQAAVESLAAFQGPAETTAQRYTDNATPPPNSGDDEPLPPGTMQTRPRVGAYTAVDGALREDTSDVGGAQEERALVPTKQREGDQRLPEVNDRPFVQDLLIADIEERKAVGVARYGTPLQAMNGRNTFLDAYEEAVDQATYLRALMEERDEMRQAAEFVAGYLSAMSDGNTSDVAAKARRIAAWLSQ